MTNQCIPRQTLKEYLSGWSDPSESDEIESHLASCYSCEQTVVALESDPDTLVELVRQGNEADSADDSMDALLGNAHRQFDSTNPSEPVDENEEPEGLPVSQLDDYELLERLGQGGMGSVYLGRHRRLRKSVAIKLLPRRSFRREQFAARFQREMRAAGGLDHPAIVRVTDAGEVDDIHYLVMEHIVGSDLSRVARANPKLSIADCSELTRQVAQGLECAHAAGIVHRDIKPSNLMLSESGAVKILDFGLARLGPWDEASAELTTVGQLMGTLDYMAPEQAERADSVDYRADLYALGATLFRLLTGRPPLAASPDLSPLAKLRLLATHQPPNIRTLRPDVPVELAELVHSLLAREPDARPPSASHVVEALAPFAEGHNLTHLAAQTASAPPPSLEQGPIAPQIEALATNGVLPAAGSLDHTPPTTRWLTWLLLPILGLAGVLITLETQKGLLVIESEVGDVTVQVLSDGQTYRELKIEQGINTTRLYAGKYSVQIAGGSDSITVEDSAISLKKMDTEVARIRLNPQPPPMGALPASDSKLSPGESITVTSFVDKTLQCTTTVMADYMVRLPFIGNVSVKGHTTDSLAQELNKRYIDEGIYANPMVDVFRSSLRNAPGGDADLMSNSADRLRQIPPASDAPLQPGDALRLVSWADSTLYTEFVVQADTTVKLPLIGTISAKGHTLDSMQEVLEEAYSEHLKTPGIDLYRNYNASYVDNTATSDLGGADTPALENRLEQLESRLDEILKQLANAMSVGQANQQAEQNLALAETLRPLNQQKFSLMVEAEDLENRLAKDHPTVRAVYAKIATINKLIADAEAKSKPELVYQDLPLSVWISKLQRERSSLGLGQAFEAIRALGSPENGPEISAAILAVLPTLNENILIDGQEQDADYVGFDIINQVSDTPTMTRILQEQLDAKREHSWRERVLNQIYSPDQASPMAEWISNEIIGQSPVDPLAEEFGYLLVALVNGISLSSAQIDQVLEKLNAAPELSSEFWLKTFPETSSKKEFQKIVLQRAVDALVDEGSSSTDVAQAAILLGVPFLQNQLSAEQRTTTIAAVVKRLSLEERTTMAPVNRSYKNYMTPGIHKSVQRIEPQAFMNSRRSRQPGSMVILVDREYSAIVQLKLLELLQSLDGELHQQTVAENHWLEECEAGHNAVQELLDSNTRSYSYLTWGTFDWKQAVGPGTTDSSATREQWIDHFIFTHLRPEEPEPEQEIPAN